MVRPDTNSAVHKVRIRSFPPPAPADGVRRALTEAYPDTGIRVHMTFEGGNVYEDTFRGTAVVDGVFQPTLLLIVTRLGVDSINPLYWESLKATLRMKQSIGIAGCVPHLSPLPQLR
jgi:cysteine protease ATG4